jgi:ATP-binding cassette subfamily C protein
MTPVFSLSQRAPTIDSSTTPSVSEIRAVLERCRGAFWGLGVFSGISNVLMLTGSFFMLQVYDRVLPSQSIPTLVALGIIATVLYIFQGLLDVVRGRMNVRVGRFLDQALSTRIYDALIRLPLKTRGDGDGMQPLRDLDQIRNFLASGGPSALFDLPWMPLYIGICFLFHPLIGVATLIGACLLVGLALITDVRTRAPTKRAAILSSARSALAAAGRRNTEVLQAMGMAKSTAARWSEANRDYLDAHERASDAAASLLGISKTFRAILQSAVLGLGAYLVIQQEATAGVIIAASILTARALAPVELAITHWKGFSASRDAAQRLKKLLTLFPNEPEPMDLLDPVETFSVNNISIVPPGAQRPVIQDVSFMLEAGQGLGIIGPSGSGKSSLVRALVGVWEPNRGKVMLDGAALSQWPRERLGNNIGYLPQDIELFDGSVALNIARFSENADPLAILEAAQTAGVHDLILSLPDGYATKLGEFGAALSGGQRQRIALARALYGKPFLVVLDEPSSNLDAEGEAALTRAIKQVRARGGIVIIVAHRPNALAAVDHVMLMAGGRVQAFGSKDEVLKTVLAPPSPPVASVKSVASAVSG